MNTEQTSKRLHTYIYQIRRVMKNFDIEKGVLYENKSYRLASKRVKSDIEKFENIIKESTKNNIDDKVNCLEEAIHLYRSEYLKGFYSQWVIDERRRLEQIYLLSLERLSKIYIEAKEYNRAVDYLHIMIKTDPLLEKAHEMLMIVYKKMDNRIAVIHQYESFYQTLKSELGIEPKSEMKDLYSKLLKEK